MPASTFQKEQVRTYLQSRFGAKTPPESPARIREIMGMAMLEAELEARNVAATKTKR